MKFCVITDCRMGVNGELDYYLRKMNENPEMDFEVIVVPKAGIEKICAVADEVIAQNPLNIYYICAGIFDLVQSNTVGKSYFDYDFEDDVYEDLKEKFITSVSYLRCRHNSTLIHLPTLTGTDLKVSCEVVPDQAAQYVLNAGVNSFNGYIAQLNYEYGSTTPDLAQIIHRYKEHTGFQHQYDRLNDGTMGTLHTILLWARVLYSHFKSQL